VPLSIVMTINIGLDLVSHTVAHHSNRCF